MQRVGKGWWGLFVVWKYMHLWKCFQYSMHLCCSLGNLVTERPGLLFALMWLGMLCLHFDQKDGSRKQLKEFLTDWEGYGPQPDSWEPHANLSDTQLVEDHWDYVALCEQHMSTQTKQSSHCTHLSTDLFIHLLIWNFFATKLVFVAAIACWTMRECPDKWHCVSYDWSALWCGCWLGKVQLKCCMHWMRYSASWVYAVYEDPTLSRLVNCHHLWCMCLCALCLYAPVRLLYTRQPLLRLEMFCVDWSPTWHEVRSVPWPLPNLRFLSHHCVGLSMDVQHLIGEE